MIPILDDDIVRGMRCFVTRLHPRHDAEHVPDDLRFRESAEGENFPGREFLRHPWAGAARHGLATFSAWPIAEIRERKAKSGRSTPDLEGAGGR